MHKADLIRFVTSVRHRPYGHRTGIIHAAYAMLRANRWPGTDRKEARVLLDWIGDNLAIPTRFTASRDPRAARTGISWVKASAKEHVGRIRRLAELIEAAGIAVHELRTTRPGYILYEDSHQVVALPFADTPR